MGFYTARIQGKNTLENIMRRMATFLFYQTREKIAPVKRDLGVLIFAVHFFRDFRFFLAIFANLNTREIFLDVKFAKIHTHEIFLQLKFAKINTRKKKLSLSGREDKKDNLQNTTYIFPKPNRSQLYNIVCFSF